MEQINFKKFDKKIIQAIIVALLMLLSVLIAPINAQSVYVWNYIVDAISLFVVIISLIIYSNEKGFNMFEPIYFISAIYAMMYFVTPMYDILTEYYTWFGYHLFPHGIKATIICLVGYLVFYYVYRYSNRNKEKQLLAKLENNKEQPLDTQNHQLMIFVILAMCAFCFAANIYYMLNSGNSLLYVLTLGMFGSSGGEGFTNQPIGFVSMFSYSLPAAVLLYCEYGKSKTLKIVMLVLMFMLQVARGFRFFVIQIVVTFFAYYFIRKDKKPKIKTILSTLLLMMIPIMLMTLFRNSIRAGNGMNLESITWETIQDGFEAAFWDNLRLYQNFYGMVAVIPEKYGYVYGRQIIIGTAIMFIPRALWPGKISMSGGVPLQTLIGPNIAAGQAYPNIGEYYYALGICGVLLFMALYAWWMKREFATKGNNNAGALNNIIFAVLLGSNLQLVIRGYTPSNFWYVIFAILPALIIKLAFFNKKRMK